MKRSRDRESRVNVKVLIYVTEKYAHEKKLHLILAYAVLALLDAFLLQSKVAVKGATARSRPLLLITGLERSICCLERKVSRKENFQNNKNTKLFPIYS